MRLGRTAIAVAVVLAAIVAAYAMTSNPAPGPQSSQNTMTAGTHTKLLSNFTMVNFVVPLDSKYSVVQMNPVSGAGTVYLNITNTGSAAVSIHAITLTVKAPWAVIFEGNGLVAPGNPAATYAGSPGTAISNGALTIPGGGSASVTLVYSGGMGAYFDVGAVYNGNVYLADGTDTPFTLTVTAV